MSKLKESIINMYYDEHMLPSSIATKLNVTAGYITQVIQKDARYADEKAQRKEMNRIKHNKATSEIMKQKREEQKLQASFIKLQHEQASMELSSSPTMSDLTFKKWNPSVYHITKSGNIVIDRKLNVGIDIPKKINSKVYLPTQKYKNKYCYSV